MAFFGPVPGRQRASATAIRAAASAKLTPSRMKGNDAIAAKSRPPSAGPMRFSVEVCVAKSTPLASPRRRESTSPGTTAWVALAMKV